MILKNLSKRFNDKVLFENINLKINKGLLYIKGESGCGKTTLINIIMGIEKPTTGSVIFENEESFSYFGTESLLFLEESLIKNLKMLNVDYSLDELEKFALIFNIKNKVDIPLYKLSGGERKKCELIYSILKKANIYIFDEPLVSLDSNAKKEFINIVKSLKESHLVILINHESNFIELNYTAQIIFTNNNIEIINESENKFLLEPIKKKKIKSFLFTLKNYIRNFKLDILITSILMLVCLILFISGCCFYDSKSLVDRTLISLKEDPFKIHSLRVNDNNMINEKLFTGKNGYFSLCITSKEDNTIYQKKEKQHQYASKFLFVEILNNTNDTIYVYQTNINNKLDSKNLILNSNIYNLENVNQDFINNKYDYSLELADAFEHNTYDYVLLTPYSFIDQILMNGLNSLKFEEDNFDFIEFPGINTLNGLICPGNNNIIIDNTKDEYYVATSKMIDKLMVKDSTNNIYEEIININYDNTLNDNEIIMSLNSFKDFLIHASKYNKFYYYSTNYYGYIDSLNYGNFIPNNIITSTTISFYDKSIFMFSLSLIVFLILLIYKIFSINGKKRYYRYILAIYNHNGINKKRFFLEFLLIRLIPFYIFTALLIIFYNYLFLNISNYYLMISTHKAPIINGIKYGYYSMQNENDYYDLLTKPIKFFSFEPIIYCILLFSIFYLIYIIKVYFITRKLK